MFHRKLTGKSLAATLMAAASATALLAMPAFAQQTPADDTRLNVVIITANQREENLQDVPVSAASLPQEQIESIFSSGEDVLALAARVPAVYAESSNGRVAPRFYIRGLGNTDFDLAASQPVSIIMDDVVMENVVLKSTPIFDVDRIEVYRGPQGTLFGRNTTAGIVRFTSVKPTEEFDARAQASYGTYGTMTFDGAVGGAISPGVAARASVLFQHRDDWIDNTRAPGRDNIGGYDEFAGRVQVAFEPMDKLDVLLNLHARDLDGTAAIFRANVITPGTNGLNSNYTRDRVTFNQGGDNPQNYTGWGASANVGYDFGDLQFTSITAYESTQGSSRGDIDGGVAGVGPGFIDRHGCRWRAAVAGRRLLRGVQSDRPERRPYRHSGELLVRCSCGRLHALDPGGQFGFCFAHQVLVPRQGALCAGDLQADRPAQLHRRFPLHLEHHPGREHQHAHHAWQQCRGL